MAVVSKDLIRRLRGAEHAYNKRLLSTWASLEGNPRGAGYLETDWGTLFFSKANPGNSIFNHAGCLTGEMLDALDEIEAAYEARGIPATVETAACELPDNLREGNFAEMMVRDYKPHQVEGLFYSEVDREFAGRQDGVEVLGVSEGDTEIFLELYLTGWEYPDDIAALWRRIGGSMQDDPNYFAFIARVGGEPAGCAQFYLHEKVGYLADACVLPEFRRMGCQRALFAARSEVARGQGAELVFSIAEIGSQSANNMEAFGLRMATELWHWRRETAKEIS